MARIAVNRQMGNSTLAQEAAHHVWFPAWIEGIGQDLRYAWRGLSRNWALILVACLSLGLSTGFGTALFSVVNAVILQPVTASHPDALVRFWAGSTNRMSNRVSWLTLRDLCEETPGVTCAGHIFEELLARTRRTGASFRPSRERQLFHDAWDQCRARTRFYSRIGTSGAERSCHHPWVLAATTGR